MADPLLDLRLDAVPFCVIDVETTGFSPTRDAIVEVGCVRLSPGGQIADGFSSLINPRLPVRGTDVHGIRDGDVANAPVLADVAGHIARCMSGAVLVSYNLYFDFAFLRRQLLEPLEIEDDIPRLCCMYLRGLLDKKPARRKLADALAERQLPTGEAHCAYDDAMATSLLLRAYLADAQGAGIDTFGKLAEGHKYQFLTSWSSPIAALPHDLKAAPAVPRKSSFALGADTPTEPLRPHAPVPVLPLQRSVDRVWASFGAGPAEGPEAYLACLCDALSDRLLTPAEMASLTDCARYYRLAPDEVAGLHRSLYDAVVQDAHAHGATDEVRADLSALAALLGVNPEAPAPALATPPAPPVWRRIALATVAVPTLLYLGFVAFLFLSAGSALPEQADIAIVYGNTVHPDGTPSARLVGRLDAARQLHANGQVERVLVSGGVGTEGHDEAAVMAAWLVEHGVPESRVLIDSNGLTTAATSRNAFAQLGPQTTVVAVSQRFHVSRAMMSLRHAGFQEVRGQPAAYSELRDVYAYTREVPAWLSYWWQVK